MAYDVGTAVLHVVPSFRDIEGQLKKMLNGLGKQLSESVSEGVDKGVGDGLKTATEAVERRAAEVGEQVSEGITKGVKDAARNAGKAAQRTGDEIGKKITGAFERNVRGGLEQMLKDLPDLKADVDLTPDQQALKRLRDTVKGLLSDTSGILATDEGLQALRRVRTELAELSRDAASVSIKIDAEAAVRSADQALNKLLTDAERAAQETARRQERAQQAAHAKMLREEAAAQRQRQKIIADAEKETARRVVGAFERRVRDPLEQILRDIPEVKIDVDLEPDQKALQRLRRTAKELLDDTSGILATDEGFKRLRQLREEMKQLSVEARSVKVRIEADAGVRTINQAFEGMTSEVERSAREAEQRRQQILDAAHAEALRMEERFQRERAKAVDVARVEILRREARQQQEREKQAEAARVKALREEEKFQRDIQRIINETYAESVKEAEAAAKERAKAAERAFDATWAGRVRKNMRSAFEAIPVFEIKADSKPAQREITQVRNELQRLAGARIGIDIDSGQALAIIQTLRTQLTQLAGSKAPIEVRIAAAQALAELAAVKKSVDEINGRRANVHVTADTDSAARSLRDVGSALEVNLGRLGALISLWSSVGTAIVPIAAAAAASIGFIGTAAAAAAAGVGTLILGFSGIGEAVKAMVAYQDDADKSAASLARSNFAVAGATDQIASAERSLANVRANNEQAARRAARAIEEAERAVARAQEDAKQATLDLIRARKEEQRANEDLQLDLEGLAIAQRRAALDQIEAKKKLDAIMSNPRATEEQREAAQVAYDEIELRLRELALRQERLTEQQQENARVGIDGSERVQRARERERSATEGVESAERRLAEALEAQREQQRQSAFALQQAQQQVATAQRAMQRAVTQSGIAGMTVLDNLQESMERLSPTGRRFAKFLFSLRDEFLDLRAVAQDNLLPGVQSAIERLLPHLPAFSDFVGKVAESLGWMFDETSRIMTTDPTWRKFWKYVGDNTVPTLERLFSIGEKVTRGLLGLFLAFTPFNDDVGGGIEGLAEQFAQWATTLDENEGFQNFLKYVREEGPEVVGMIKEMVFFIGRFIKASAPIGAGVVDGFTMLFDLLNKIPTDTLTLIIGGIGAVAAALGVMGAATLIASKGLATLYTVGIAAAIVYLITLYQKVEWFRDVVDTVWQAVSKAVLWLYDNVIKPVFENWSWYLTEKVAPALQWLWGHVIKPWWDRVRVAFSIGFAAVKVGFGLFQIAIKLAASAWRAFYDRNIRPVWLLVRPIFQALGKIIKEDVQPAFEQGVRNLGKAWDKLVDLTKKPIRFVVNTVLNDGLLAVYNDIARKFNVKPDDVKVSLPPGFATGGEVIGPGTSVSDSILARLSDGEHIWTAREVRAAGGHRAVRRLRRAALAGAIPGFRDGGGVGDGLGDIWRSARKRVGDAVTGVRDLFLNPTKALKDLAKKLLKQVPGQNSLPVRLLTGVGTKAAETLVDKVTSFLGGPDGNPPPGSGNVFGGSAGMMRVLRAAFPGLRLISGYRPNSRTLTGNLSYHARDRAVDLDPLEKVARWIHQTYGRLTRELITPWHKWNLHNGRSHRYTGAVWNQHNFAGGNAHVHWAYDNGGWLPPGVTTVVNNTGRPEPVLNPGQWDLLARNVRNNHAEARAVQNHFHFKEAALDIGRLQGIQARQDALARAGRPR